MTDAEKKLLQAQHRLEEAQARDRVKERKARTRRLIQEGAILEKVLPEIQAIELPELEGYLSRKLGKQILISDRRSPGNRGPSSFSPEGRTYSPPQRGGGIAFGNRALCEADAAPAEASRQCHSTCECCCHRLCDWANTVASTDAIFQPPAQTCHRQLCRRDGRAFCPSIFSLRKRNRKKKTR